MSKEDDRLMGVLKFVDKNGSVVSKHGTPVNSSLSMKYSDGPLKITMDVYVHCQGNGSCSAKVVYKSRTVYKAAGNFTTRPFNTEENIYIPGNWEDKLGAKQ